MAKRKEEIYRYEDKSTGEMLLDIGKELVPNVLKLGLIAVGSYWLTTKTKEMTRKSTDLISQSIDVIKNAMGDDEEDKDE